MGSRVSKPSSNDEQTDIERAEGNVSVEAPSPGTRVGRYWLTQLVGSGGMGRVYAAYDPQLDRVVALKLLRSLGSGGAEHRARLQREAQALARLSHPNVVPVFDVGSSGPWLFIAMELIEGPDLLRWIAAGRRDWREVVDVFLGAARGLAAAHAAGLVHRDFKPGNVVVDADGRARVLDFGLVRMGEARDTADARHTEPLRGRSASQSNPEPDDLPEGLLGDELTADGTVLGTPVYMAPEQHRGKATDARSDQFSFCMSLYEALYARRPYKGAGIALLEHKERGPLSPPRKSEVPPRLWAILRRGLSAEPRERWPGMAALAEELSSASIDPRARVRRVATISAISMGTLFALSWTLLGSTPRCDPGGTELDAVWSPDRARSLREAMHASNPTYAAPSWASVRDALDEFSSRWGDAYAGACMRATDDATLDRQMDCLRGQLDTVDALVTVLGDGAPDALEHAAFAAAQLPDPGDCDMPTALGASTDPVLRSQLASARALGSAGRHAPALEAARAVESAARAAGDQDLEIEAALLVATTSRTLGDREDAGQRLRDVTWAAVAAKRDDIATKAATAMASLLITDNALDEAETWLRHAETSLRRAPVDLVTQARLLQTRGTLLARRGLLEDGLAQHARAASMLSAGRSVDDLTAVQAVAEVADLQARLGRFDEAAQGLQRILDTYELRLGADHPALAKPLGSLAGVRYRQRRFEEALVYTRRALAIDEQVYPAGHRQLTTRRSHLGLLLHELKRHDEALALAEQVHEARLQERGPDHPEVAQALYNIGHVLLGMGENDQAVPYFERALTVWETVSGASHLDLAYPLASLGEARFHMGRVEQAIEPLEQALGLLEGDAEAALRTSVIALLAQALWDGGGDRKRALALAAEAHQALTAGGEPVEGLRLALEGWYARVGHLPPAHDAVDH